MRRQVIAKAGNCKQSSTRRKQGTDRMSDTAKRKQIIYRANHRGIKEMDILLGGYADARVMTMDDAELASFEALMAESDRDLLSWFTGEVPVPDGFAPELIGAILDHARLAFKK